MYIELFDLLRCPRVHEETWLVAAFMQMDGRYVITGRLGCPVCSASFAVENGIADLRDHTSSSGKRRDTNYEGDESAIRLAAMLGLARPGLLIAISGEENALAKEISDVGEAKVVALNPPDSLEDSERVARVLSGARIPLASSSLDGLVMTSNTDDVLDAARLLKPGGRLVLKSRDSLPPQFRELARDDEYVVAESSGPMIQLSR